MALIKDTSGGDPNAQVSKIFHKAGKPLVLNEAQKIALNMTKRYPDIAFFVVPTKSLTQDILNGKTDIVKELPEKVTRIFSFGNGLTINQDMLIEYAEGTLDPRNRYIMERCDISYVGIIPECLRFVA